MQVIRDDIDFEAWMVEPDHKQKVRAASSYVEELIQRMTLPEEANGTMLPWRKTTSQFRLRKNEVTLWPGINGHGKSLIIGQIMLGAMAQGDKVLVASMEMKPVSTMQRMCHQAHGLENVTTIEAREFAAWTDNRLWIYDHLGSESWRKLIGVFRYCCAEIGITQIVIDSLMRCGIADDDYQGQKAFMDALCTLKMDYPVHIHLILHSRKLTDESQLPGKFDVKGTGTLTDLADNVVTVWRNKRKEDATKMPSYMRSEKDETAMKGPDCLLVVDKQRHHEWEGKISLWYASGSQQYLAEETGKTTNIMEMFA